MLRIGLGHDTHRLTDGSFIMLGGVRIEHSMGLLGHSDADVLLHAIIDALLGASGFASSGSGDGGSGGTAPSDIGEWFPDTDPINKNRNSAEMLKIVWEKIQEDHWHIVNLDTIIFAEKPKIAPYKEALRQRIAGLLDIDPTQIGIKAKTGEKVGMIGREEAISAECVVLLERVHEWACLHQTMNIAGPRER